MNRRILALLCILSVIGLSGCIQAVGPSAQFTISPDDHGYPPFEASFDASASSSPDAAVVDYAWDFGDGTTATGVTTTHTFDEKGVYNVTLTITDSSGQSGTRTRMVEALNRTPLADFTIIPNGWVSPHSPVTFDASASSDSDGEIVEYLWDFGDGSTAEGVVVDHEFPLLGGGSWKPQITLTVVDENGGTGTRTLQINVVGCASCGS